MRYCQFQYNEKSAIGSTLCGGSASEAFAPPCPPSDEVRCARVDTLLATEVIVSSLMPALSVALVMSRCCRDDYVGSTIRAVVEWRNTSLVFVF